MPTEDMIVGSQEFFYWEETIRVEIQEHSSTTSESMLLPQNDDIILQVCRCLWVCVYWQGCSNKEWSWWDMGAATEVSGYVYDTGRKRFAALYECSEGIRERDARKSLAFLSCNCVRCDTRRCACIKAEWLCMPGICGKCSRVDPATGDRACKNTGTPSVNDMHDNQSFENLPCAEPTGNPLDPTEELESEGEEDPALVLPHLAANGSANGLEAFVNTTCQDSTYRDDVGSGPLADLDTLLFPQVYDQDDG